MSEQNHEHRIAELEKSLADAHEASKGMFMLINVMADFQRTATVKMHDWMMALETRNNEALEIAAQALPDMETRQKLKDVLARNVFDRDQLEAMMHKFKAFRPNPEIPPATPGSQAS